MTGINPTRLHSSSATATRIPSQQAQQAFYIDSNGNRVPIPSNMSAAELLYLEASVRAQAGMHELGGQIAKIKPGEDTKNSAQRFVRNRLAKVAEAVLPVPEPVDSYINKNYGKETELSTQLLGYLITSLQRISHNDGITGFFKANKLQLAWDKLSACNEPEDVAKLLKLDLEKMSPQEQQSALQMVFAAWDAKEHFEKQFNKQEFKDTGITKEDFFNTVSKRFSFARQIGAFVVFLFLGSGAFNIGRFFLQAGAQPLAQLSFLLGTGLASTQSFLIGENVTKQMTFDHLSPRMKALIPFVQLATILSHSVSPVLNMLGIAFNFDGVISGGQKDNLFGKINGFFNTAFELLRPASMLGFALNHLNGLEALASKIKENKAYANTNDYKWSKGFERYGFWANMVGFGLWSISQVASFFIERHEKKVNAKYEPIIKEIQDKLMMVQEMLKEQVIAGKITKEEAIAKLTQMEAEAKQFVQTELLPQYDAEMKGWKTASWLVGVVNWLAFLGITVQMYTNKPRMFALGAARIQDHEALTGKKIGFGKAFKQAMDAETGNHMQTTMLYGGMAVGSIGLVASTFLDGFSTLFSKDSPFKQYDKAGLGDITEKARRNPFVSAFLNLFFMFG